jgi:hypothetical protein
MLNLGAAEAFICDLKKFIVVTRKMVTIGKIEYLFYIRLKSIIFLI